MPIKKIYRCCICHKVLDTKPHRLVHQEFSNSKAYGLYKNKHNYDFCTKCFGEYLSWLKEMKKNSDDK